MAKTVCKILGVVFLLVGVVGFAAPTLLGFHLSPAHNVIHIVSGALALYFGFAGTLAAAKTFCLAFGVVYLALGILGLVVGAGVDMEWKMGPLVLGRVDHGFHALVGIIFLASGLFTKRVD